jgi:hypothetical protein
MILPAHFNELLDVLPQNEVVILDLRSRSLYERSHVHNAASMRLPVVFIEHSTLDAIRRAIEPPSSRRAFTALPTARALVFYDHVLEVPQQCPAALALHARLRAEGWTGEAFVLKGHFKEFADNFDRCIESSNMTQSAVEFLSKRVSSRDNVRHLSSSFLPCYTMGRSLWRRTT